MGPLVGRAARLPHIKYNVPLRFPGKGEAPASPPKALCSRRNYYSEVSESWSLKCRCAGSKLHEWFSYDTQQNLLSLVHKVRKAFGWQEVSTGWVRESTRSLSNHRMRGCLTVWSKLSFWCNRHSSACHVDYITDADGIEEWEVVINWIFVYIDLSVVYSFSNPCTHQSLSWGLYLLLNLPLHYCSTAIFLPPTSKR